MLQPTPSSSHLAYPRWAEFDTVAQALDYAATGSSGLNFYSGKGELVEVLPYRDLREQAMILARKFLAAGLRPGDRVAMLAETDGDFVRAFYACQYAGLVPAPMPLPVALGGKDAYIAHIRRMIERAEASAAIGPAALQDWLAQASEGLGLRLVGSAENVAALPTDGVDLPKVGRDALCYLQFSSGSTRFPLGVAVTQAALMANANAITRYGLVTRPGDRCVSWLPLYHDMGLVGFLLTPLVSQLSVDYMPTREFARRPFKWLELITRNGGTLSYSPSFGYELCARRAETASTEGLDLTHWRVAGIGGDMIRPQVLTRFVESFASRGFGDDRFVASYGMAEATLALSFAPLGRGMRAETLDTHVLETEARAEPAAEGAPLTRGFVFCGVALPGHMLEARDGRGAVLPERRVGRLFAKGPSLMQSYFGSPDETAAALSADGWLDTGDLGYFIDGQVVVTGRAKDLIIVKGRNIWPQDLEWTAESEVASLRSGDVAVFSVDGGAGEEVIALVQCRSNDPDARASLREAVAGALRARHGVDASVVLVPNHALPQTSSGKLSRSKARELYRQGTFAPPPGLVAAV